MNTNNIIELEGNLARDMVVVPYAKTEGYMLKSTLCVDRGKDIEPMYINITMFCDDDETARVKGMALKKGYRVRVMGSLDTGSYTTTEGFKQLTVAIIAKSIMHVADRIYAPPAYRKTNK